MAVSKGTIRRYGSRGGGGGGGGTRFYEGDLPDADKAPKKTILVRETDNTKWRVGYRTIETVDATISSEDFVAPVSVVFFGVNTFVEPEELRAGYAVFDVDGWQYKPTGSLFNTGTVVNVTIADYPFQGALDTAPTEDTAGSYLDTVLDQFFR